MQEAVSKGQPLSYPTLMNIAELYNLFLKSTGICTDSRKPVPGSIFFAIRGENFDGNRFAADALRKGCIHAVVDDPSIPENNHFTRAGHVVDTLQQLAAFHRDQLKIPFIAITGSNGKTTTKELCKLILEQKFTVLATQGNLNNHIGVPLTILSVKNEKIAVIEIGANHEGEIKSLCPVARPDYGLITNIGLAHLEGFKSPEGIVRGKGELYDYLKEKNGHAFYNASSAILAEMIRRKQVRSIPYGEHPDSVCKGSIKENERFLTVDLQFGKQRITAHSRLVGDYNLENLIAAAAVGNYFGVRARDIRQAVESYIPANARSQYITTGKNKLILDAYNANPSSMRSSILNFSRISEKMEKVLILGDMLELGEYEEEEHLRILQLVGSMGFKEVFLVGPMFMRLNTSEHFKSFENVENLMEYLVSHLTENRFILIKGSRGIKLEKVFECL
jgi:UDP-N-acetylmuramoyl-tripeptide--D-alanyl-D-alanine ligase